MKFLNRSTRLALIASAAVLAAGAAAAKMKSKAVFMPAEKMAFKALVPGVTRAVLWGDPDQGAHGTLTRFAAGTKHALHSHANDLRIVVLSGAYLYTTDSGTTKVGPGSYLLVPAGSRHMSGSDEETLFLEESRGKFTLDFASAEAKTAAKP